MRHNSGIIGARQPVSYQSAVGVHDTMDAMIAVKQNRWPPAKTYISVSLTSNVQYNEGTGFAITVNLSGFLNGELIYYTIDTVSGTVNTSDFNDGIISGSLTVNNNTCTLSKTLTFDGTSEVGDSFVINIREGSTTGTIKLTTGIVTINNPTFAVTPAASSVNEGSSVTWTINTTNINNGTTLFYTISGVEAADINTTSGSFTINSNTGSFSTTAIADALTEGAQTMTANIRFGSTGGTVVATNTCVINDTSLAPTVTSDVTTIDENNSSVVFTVTTSGLTNGTLLYWSTNIVSGTVDTNDFTDNSLVGSFTISSNSATITRTIRNDFITEGTESFNLSIRTGSTSGTVVATTPTITVTDTSLAPTATVTPDVTSVNEGGTVTFTVNTTNFTSGTLYWTTAKVGSFNIRESDFSDNTLSGTVIISGGTGTISRTLANDGFTEGSEQFTLSVRTSSVSGTIIGTSPTITVGDTSTGGVEPAFDITAATFTMRRSPTNNNTIVGWNNIVYSPVTNNFWVMGAYYGSYTYSFGTTFDVFTGRVAYSTDGNTWTVSATETNFIGGLLTVMPSGTILGTQLGGVLTRIAPVANTTTFSNITPGIAYRDYSGTFMVRPDGSFMAYDGYSNQPSATSSDDGLTWTNVTTVPNRVAHCYSWNDNGTNRYYISDFGTTLTYYSLDAGVTSSGTFTYFGYIVGYQNFLVGLNGTNLYIYEMNGAAYTVKATITSTSGKTWQTATMNEKMLFVVEASGSTYANQECILHKIEDITVASPSITQSRSFTGLNSSLHYITYVPHQNRIYMCGTYGAIATLQF